MKEISDASAFVSIANPQPQLHAIKAIAMPPRKPIKAKPNGSPKSLPGSPPEPFKPAPELIQKLFASHLEPQHIYIAHVDNKPAVFKRKIFIVPVAMNLAIAGLFVLRMLYILPYYWALLMSGFGHPNETTLDVESATWGEIAWEISRRTITFMLDFALGVFVWPWPLEFCLGARHGNPVWWRWRVGFREKEVYVRRSREWGASFKDAVNEAAKRQTLLSLLRRATNPSLLAEKTGYLTMSGQWDLDWAAMVHAHELVDQKLLAMEAFRCLVLVHHEEHGWMSVDLAVGENAKEEERRRQIFAFRDALVSLEQEALFFRWIEVIQFESTRPEGFTPERQEEVAKMVREMFQKEGIDFDGLWKETVGSDGLAGM